MTIRKFISGVFAVLGTVLLVFSVGLCLLSLDARVRMKAVPDGAKLCAEAFYDAVNRGDLAAASGLIYGQPDLGVEAQPSTQQGEMVWNAYKESLTCEFSGDYFATQTGLSRKAEITALDISALMGNLAAYAGNSMSAKVSAAENPEELYDENNNYRETLVEQVLLEAMRQALSHDAATVAREVTIRLTYRDGSWWIMPDQELLQTLSGL